jgi:hypothetical protein
VIHVLFRSVSHWFIPFILTFIWTKCCLILKHRRWRMLEAWNSNGKLSLRHVDFSSWRGLLCILTIFILLEIECLYYHANSLADTLPHCASCSLIADWLWRWLTMTLIDPLADPLTVCDTLWPNITLTDNGTVWLATNRPTITLTDCCANWPWPWLIRYWTTRLMCWCHTDWLVRLTDTHTAILPDWI